MAVNQVAVVLFEEILTELPVLVPSDAVVQPIDRLALSGHIEQNLTGTVNHRDYLGVDFDLAPVIDNGKQVLQGQIFAVQQ